MTSPKTDRFRLSVLTAGVVGLLATGLTPASAQQPQLPQGWFKACTKQEEVDICNVQNIVTASNGQLVTGISLIELKGKVNRKVFQVTVPTGRLVPPGIGLQSQRRKGAEARLRHLLSRPLRRGDPVDGPARRFVQEGLRISRSLR